MSHVLLGWNLPAALLEACARESNVAGARLYRWDPTLTGDGSFVPRQEWQTVGLGGSPVPGFQDRPEFTFVCPNRPGVVEAVAEHLLDIAAEGRYQGLFLDRIRYPSPAADPARLLACFCEDCHHVASIGADLCAFRDAGADGLVLSWDLWHIPLERLELVHACWVSEVQTSR